MPRDQRLGQADLGDELGHGRFGAGKGANDPEAVHVGQRLVDQAQLAQLFGLEDGVGDRAANARRRGAQGFRSNCINVRLYQSPLMLFAGADRCQTLARRQGRETLATPSMVLSAS
jgi:hypothetical protein